MICDNIDALASTGPEPRWWRAAVVHEMGHQRAALKEYREDVSLHWPETYDTGYRCIMHQVTGDLPAEQASDILLYSQFCGYRSDTSSGQNSCVKFIYERGRKP